jgi:hypothetical protein
MTRPDPDTNAPRQSRPQENPSSPSPGEAAAAPIACPVCGGKLIEIRGKLQCSQCHTISETCCEGGPG